MEYYVSITASVAQTLYVGITTNLERRMYQHRMKTFHGFSARYNVSRLGYYESGNHLRNAIAREQQIKDYRRSKKTAL
jgi:putative endonuclease